MRLTCLFFLLVIAAGSQAQEQPLLHGSFSGIPFTKFAATIEQSTPYRFYFDPATGDSITVQVKAENETLSEVLKKIFSGTDFHFAIDAEGHVFITHRVPIRTQLPSDFFSRPKISGTIDTSLVGKPLRLSASQPNKLLEIGSKAAASRKEKATIAGYVRDQKNGEPLIGAIVYTDTPSVSATTDQYGYYALSLPRGRHILHTSGPGMQELQQTIQLYDDGKLDIVLQDYIPSLKNVVVVSERHSHLRSTRMGVDQLTIRTIRQVPVVFGETDVLRVVLSLPGVSSVGEATTGFHVRGGSADQNLILFSDATIYNPAHLFGFFSAFNPDLIKGVELYKSGIPEKFGGRLSSVLDITTREGNSKKIAGSGGIGLLTSKLMVEGPLVKDKTTFILGGRTTYSNWLLKKIPNSAYRNSRASFYDGNLQISHTVNARNHLYFTGYISQDRFRLNNDSLYDYGNRNGNIKWKHIFNNQWNSVVTAGYDRYHYQVASEENRLNAFRLRFGIGQAHFRADFNHTAGNRHAVNFGLHSIYYKMQPGAYTPFDEQSKVRGDRMQQEQALESALYLGDRFTVSPRLSVQAGVRYSFYQFLGPKNLYLYLPGLPRTTHSITDTVSYPSRKIIKTYHGPEYRLSARYLLSDNSSVKLSYNTLRQYIHMLSNTTAISPTDIYKLSDPNIRPQQGFQAALGYYRNFKSNVIETSLEVYYKKMKHFLDYKSGALLLMNHHIETDVVNTQGTAYGAELMLKKLVGKFNGWMSYTWSRTWLRLDDPLAGEAINEGNYYPANFDKPHNLNFIGNYRFSHRVSVSLNVVYSTGRPITLPLASFSLGGAQRLYYSNRNQYRIPDYFRTDISMSIEGNHKLKQLTHNSWSFGIYNLTGRQNAYSVYFIQQNGTIKGYQLSIFGTLIPFITYHFRF